MTTDVYMNMKISRSNFKRAKKKCVNAAEKIKRDKFTEACLNGDKDMFEELKKLKGKSDSFSTKVDGKNTPEEIADHFSDVYKELYNRTGTKEPMINLLGEVEVKLSEDDLSEVNKMI